MFKENKENDIWKEDKTGDTSVFRIHKFIISFMINSWKKHGQKCIDTKYTTSQLMLPVKFERDAMIQTTNLAASRLHEISQ